MTANENDGIQFHKITDRQLGHDVIHVWIEDDCLEWARRMITDTLQNIVNERAAYELSGKAYSRKHTNSRDKP